MADAHKNFAISTVAVAPVPADTGTELTVAAGEGALFPTAPFNCTVWPAGVTPLASNAEIVRVTNVTGDVFTITRAQEDTTAKAIAVGWQIANTITKKVLEDAEDHSVLSPVHTDSDESVTPQEGDVLVRRSGVWTSEAPLVVGPTGTYLVSGGQVTWESDYTYRVSAAEFYIWGTRYTSAEQVISLDAADATNDRIDVIAVDDTGTVVKVTGVAAAPPTEPSVDPTTQLKLAFVWVTAATSEPPDVSNMTLYAEDDGAPSEWNWTASAGSWVLDSHNNPRTGTHCIEGTSTANNSYVQGQIGSGTIDPTLYDTLVLFVRSKASWVAKRCLSVQWQNAGVRVGNARTIATGTYGFDSGVTGAYQQVAIPISDFAIASGSLVNQLRISDSGGAIGFYIDDIILQARGTGGGSEPDPRYLQKTNNLSDLTNAPEALVNLGFGAKAANQIYAGPTSGSDALPGFRALVRADLPTDYFYVNYVIDGGNSVITTGIKGDVKMPACTLLAWGILADQSGSIVIDIWRDTYANFPPDDADSLCNGHEPTLSAAAKAQETDLSDWTDVTLDEGDILRFNVDSITTCTRVTLSLKCQRT